MSSFFVFHSDDTIDSGDSMEEDDHDSYENRLARLREKHGGTLADFKLKCWAKMLVSLDIKKISFGKIEKINPIFEFGPSKLHILKACAYICYFKLQTLSVIVHGRKIQLYAFTVFFLLLQQVNKTHHSEDEIPQVSFFTGRNKASCSTVDLPSSSSAQSSTKETTLNSISGAEEKVTLSLDTPPCEQRA